MFNARKFVPLSSAFAGGKVPCVGGSRVGAGALDMAHVTFSFPIDRGVTR